MSTHTLQTYTHTHTTHTHTAYYTQHTTHDTHTHTHYKQTHTHTHTTHPHYTHYTHRKLHTLSLSLSLQLIAVLTRGCCLTAEWVCVHVPSDGLRCSDPVSMSPSLLPVFDRTIA